MTLFAVTGVGMPDNDLRGSLNSNTKITLGILLSILFFIAPAIWIGAVKLTNIERDSAEFRSGLGQLGVEVARTTQWTHDHDRWSTARSNEIRSQMNQVRQRLGLPELPYIQPSPEVHP